MVPKSGLHLSPPARRLFRRLSWLAIFLLLLLAGQGCGNNQPESDQSEKANARGLEAVRQHDNDRAITEFSDAIRLKRDNSMAYYNRASV